MIEKYPEMNDLSLITIIKVCRETKVKARYTYCVQCQLLPTKSRVNLQLGHL